MPDLFLTFLAVILTVAAPVLGLVYGRPDYRARAFVYVPIGITFQFITIGIVAALLYQPLGYGLPKFLLVVLISTLFVAYLFEKIRHNQLRFSSRVHTHRVLWILFLLALIGTLDNFLVAGLEGYHAGEIYFRPPFNSDPQRNVFLVNALIRHDGSPFLPGATILYQTLWYHFGALFVSLFNAQTNFGLVLGVAVATSYFFFFIVLWAIYSTRPSLILRYWLAVPLLIIIFSHADVYYFLKGLLATGHPCIVADGSCDVLLGPERHFEPFSLKNAALISPQHVFFVMGLIVYLSGSRYRLFYLPSQALARNPPLSSIHHGHIDTAAPIHSRVLLVMMFLASPILSALVLPFFIFYDFAIIIWRRHWRDAIVYVFLLCGLLVIALVIYRVTLDESAIRLFHRPYVTGVEGGRILQSFFEDWTRIPAFFLTPVALIGGLGILGISAIVCVLSTLHKRTVRRLIAPEVVVLIVAAYYTNYVLGHAEVKRHVAIVLPAIGALAVSSLMVMSAWRSAIHRIVASSLAAVALVLHGYYLYSYTLKPSLISSAIPWKDYYCINGVISERYPSWPALAAIGAGLRFPLVAESAPSYARHEDATTHSRLRDETSRVIHLNLNGVHITELAGNLGIRLVVWGPVEDGAWGMKIKDRIVGGRKALERCGSVGLYGVSVAPYTADIN